MKEKLGSTSGRKDLEGNRLNLHKQDKLDVLVYVVVGLYLTFCLYG